MKSGKMLTVGVLVIGALTLWAIDKCTPKRLDEAHSVTHVFNDTRQSHNTPVDQDGTDGPPSEVKPNLHPTLPLLPSLLPDTKPSASAPKVDPSAYVYRGTILFYWCGDNIAIQDIYSNGAGAVKTRMWTRWDFPDLKKYNEELHKLEGAAVVGSDVPVIITEMDNRCIKT